MQQYNLHHFPRSSLYSSTLTASKVKLCSRRNIVFEVALHLSKLMLLSGACRR